MYLPQFHPIPENDRWWGRGFTEWRNVAKARPLFPRHYQPHLPADLGFYDLRVPETREAQAELAREYGIHGFCYYHYWFHGRRLLERPFQEVLDSMRPDFPFCLCWANASWNRAWGGTDGEILMAQQYSAEDDRQHARWLVRAFSDPRYLRVHGRPVFLVFRASLLPSPERTSAVWREEAHRHGIGELYLCRMESSSHERGDPARIGFDAAVEFQPDWMHLGRPLRRSPAWWVLRAMRLSARVYGTSRVHEYADVVRRMLRKPQPPYRLFPCVTPGWDNTPRKGPRATILQNSTPEIYGRWLAEVLRRSPAADGEENLVFLNAWNEWAEGNHLEPDLVFGRAYLEATRQALQSAEGRILQRPPQIPRGEGDGLDSRVPR
jgi:lipopolysaccharide biosynthesis protein